MIRFLIRHVFRGNKNTYSEAGHLVRNDRVDATVGVRYAPGTTLFTPSIISLNPPPISPPLGDADEKLTQMTQPSQIQNIHVSKSNCRPTQKVSSTTVCVCFLPRINRKKTHTLSVDYVLLRARNRGFGKFDFRRETYFMELKTGYFRPAPFPISDERGGGSMYGHHT